jgi:hypothetical protein
LEIWTWQNMETRERDTNLFRRHALTPRVYMISLYANLTKTFPQRGELYLTVQFFYLCTKLDIDSFIMTHRYPHQMLKFPDTYQPLGVSSVSLLHLCWFYFTDESSSHDKCERILKVTINIINPNLSFLLLVSKKAVFIFIWQKIRFPIWPDCCVYKEKGLWVGVMVFNATFNNILVTSWRSVLLVEEIGVPGENHQPAASHWQTDCKVVVNP